MKKLHNMSLKKSLYLIVLLCWVIPLLSTILWFGSQHGKNTRIPMEKDIQTSVDNATDEIARRLNSVIALSRNASYDDTIYNIFNTYSNEGDYIDLYGQTAVYLQTHYSYSDNINGAFLMYTGLSDSPVYAINSNVANKSAVHTEYLQNSLYAVMAASSNIGTDVLFQVIDGQLYLIRNLVDDTFHTYATLAIQCNEEYILESAQTVLWVQTAQATLNGHTLPIWGEHKPFDTNTLEYNKSKHIFSVGTVASTNDFQFRLEVTVSGDLLVSEQQSFYMLLCAVIMASAVLFVFVFRYFYRHINMPIESLLTATGYLEEGNLGYHIRTIPVNREFQQLTASFNSLSDRLVEQFNRSILEQQALYDARIKALQSQINPHFLNNTLEMINWQARMVGDDGVCDMIESLSVMLNAAMARGGNATVSMKEEMSYIEAYLYIVSHRFGERLQVTQDVEEKVLEAIVPRLILQPIVENAIEHGIALLPRGDLHLHLYIDGENLVLDVEHVGSITPENRKRIDTLLSWDGKEAMETGAANIGIRNVNLRLKILCGIDSGLKIWEITPGRICSRMVLPFLSNYEL